MKTIHSLSKQNLAKFLDGFNALVNETEDSRRSPRGYRGDGFEAARAIVTQLQFDGQKDAHGKVRAAKYHEDIDALQKAWDKVADARGYGPNSPRPMSIVR